MKQLKNRAGWAAAAVLAMAALCPPQVLAQVPARFYWKTLSGASAVPVIFNSMSGNTNPFDPSNLVTPDANFDATMALAGWAQTYTLGDRSAMGAILLPMGHVSGGVAGFTETSRGFGDPMLEFITTSSARRRRRRFPTCCATSRASRSTCSST